MSQQELPVVSALEFDQVRSSIKDYIRTKTDFTDYDFDGSNMSMLVDILSYNTLYTSYNVNMASNELNLDSSEFGKYVLIIFSRREISLKEALIAFWARSLLGSWITISINVPIRNLVRLVTF